MALHQSPGRRQRRGEDLVSGDGLTTTSTHGAATHSPEALSASLSRERLAGSAHAWFQAPGPRREQITTALRPPPSCVLPAQHSVGGLRLQGACSSD